MTDTRNQRKSPIKRDLLVAIIALATWLRKWKAHLDVVFERDNTTTLKGDSHDLCR